MNASIIIWMLIAISFTIYLVVSLVYKRLEINNLENALMTTNGLGLLNLKHILGIILFGIGFYHFSPELRYLVEYIEIPRLKILFPFIVIFFLIVYLSKVSFQKAILKNTTVSDYSFKSALFYFIVRFTFLLCYEFFFRGILLFKFLEYYPPYFAILNSTFLYALIHVFHSQKEFFRAIAIGILLCVFSYLTGSIWYPFIIHMAICAVYEISMFYYLTYKNKIEL